MCLYPRGLWEASITRKQSSSGKSKSRSKPEVRRGVGRPTLGGGIAEEEILDVGIVLFASKGYKGATLRELAAAVGITGGTLHHYYPTKFALYEAAFKRAAELVYSDFANAISRYNTLDERVSALLREMIARKPGRRDGLRLILRSWIDLDDSLQKSLRLPPIVEETLERIAADAVANEEIGCEDVRRLVMAFRAMAWGVVTLHLNDPSGRQAELAVEAFTRSVEGSLFLHPRS